MTETKEKEMIDVKEEKSLETALQNESWVAPLADIYENEDSYILVAQMPGVGKESVKIKIEEDNLIILGRIDYDGMRNRKYIMRETEISNYYRKFRLSESIDESKIDAGIKNGILTVTLPKHDRVKPRVIKIK